MSVIQPQVIYTGQNSARPDFKGMTRDIQTQIMAHDRQRQQQKQFDQQRQDQLNREFMKTIDVDSINLANANLQQQSVDMYDGYYKMATDLVKGKEGNMTSQDIMAGQAMANKIAQDMSALKLYDTNWRKDMQAIQNDRDGIYDKEAAKEDIFGYKGDEPYTETRLKIAPWDAESLYQEVQDNTKPFTKGMPYAMKNEDGTLGTSGNFNPTFWESEMKDGYPVPKFDKNGEMIPNYEAQGNRLKKDLYSGGNWIQGREGLVRRFDELTPQQQADWDERAKAKGLTTKLDGKVQGDGEIMYALAPDGENVSNAFRGEMKRRTYAEKSTTSGIRNLSGKKVPYLTTSRTLNVGGEEYNAYSIPEAVNIPSFTMKNATVIVDGKKSDAKDITSKGKLTDVIIEDGKISMYKIEKPSSKYKKNELGQTIYKIDNIGEGTYEELLQDAKVMYGDKVDMAWIKRKAKESKEEGRTETVLVPAEDNQSLTELFRIKGVSDIYKAKKEEATTESTIEDDEFEEFKRN